ncbi:MAG: SDR family oxidoreductase [Bacteroidota bacterium]|jgi:short-subunit dehydrogenase
MNRQSRLHIQQPVVWVTGASRGIGREIAKQFASVGCDVCLSARSTRQLKDAAKRIIEVGGRAYPFPCDLSSSASIARTVKIIQKQIGEIDVLVNNAGITVFKSFLNTSVEEFDDILATNLRGHVACIKAVLPSMLKRKQGWIFNIISTAAIKTFKDSAAYTAAKAGMLGFARVLRQEVGESNVRVVNVLPGPTETGMWSRPDRRKFSRRMMSAKSVAEAILSVYRMPEDVVVDELILRPVRGDID